MRKFLRFALILPLAAVLLKLYPALAQSTSPWLDGSLNYTIGDVEPNKNTCQPDVFEIEKASSVGNIGGVYVAIGKYTEKITVCAERTGAGKFAIYQNSTYWKPNNASLATRVNYVGYQMNYFASKASPTMILRAEATQQGLGSILVKNFAAIGTYIVDANGPTYLIGGDYYRSLPRLFSGPGTEYNYNRGYNHVHISNDGEWAIGTTQYAVVRMNLRTLQYQTIDRNPFYQGGGSSVSFLISNDGRHVFHQNASFGGTVVSSRQYVYDLSACSVFTKVDSSSVPGLTSSCKKKELSQGVATGLASPLYVIPRAFDDSSSKIELTASYDYYGLQLKKASITTTEYAQPDQNYIALGDSFASGEGAYNYMDGTDTEVNRCHTSLSSYPYLLGQRLSILAQSYACSGANSNNYSGADLRIAVQYPESSSKVFPGQSIQKSWINDKQEVVTISMAGNDVGFADKLKDCLAPFDTCFDTPDKRKQIADEIRSKFDAWAELYADVRTTAKNANVYVLGYPKLVEETDFCGVNVLLSKAERILANRIVSFLNQTIENAAAKAGVNYVDVEDGFAGQRLCSDSYPLAVNGLTAGNDNLFIIGNESYHPSAHGHVVFADTIAAQTDNLTKPNPEVSATASAPSDSSIEYISLVDGLTTQTSSPHLIENDLEGLGGLIKSSPVNLIIDGIEASVRPNVLFKVILNSDPILLQEGTVLPSGDIPLNFTVPAQATPGFHMLLIETENALGQKISLYRSVYVAESADDMDGDGIANDVDACRAVANANIDRDQDDIDDACDGDIGPEPKDTTAPTMTLIGTNDSATLDLSTAQKPTCTAKDTGNNRPMSASNPGIDLSCELNITGHAIYGTTNQLSYSAEVTDEAGNIATLQGTLNVVNPRPVTPRVQSCSYSSTSATVTSSFSYDNPNWLPVSVARSSAPDLSNVLEPSSTAQTQPTEFSVGSTDKAFTATAATHLTWRLTGLNTTTNGRTDCVIPPPAPTCQWPTRLTWYTLLQYLMCRLRTYTWR